MRSPLTSLRIVWFSLFGSIGLLAFLRLDSRLSVESGSRAASAVFTQMLFVAGIVLMFVALGIVHFILPRKVRPDALQSEDPSARARFFTFYVLSMAFAESIAVFGFIVRQGPTDSAYATWLFAMAAFTHALCFPREASAAASPRRL